MSAPRSLHVLHVTKRYQGATGGDATVVAGVVEQQRRNGHRVTVVTSACRSIADAPGVHKVGLPISDAALDRLGARRVLSCLWGLVWGFALLRRERPDVLHAHAPELGAALALPARLLGIPRVLTLHGTSIGNRHLAHKEPVECALVALGHYDRVFTVDPQALPRVSRLADAYFLPNAITRDRSRTAAVPVAEGNLLFVGRLEAVKAVDVLLAAVAKMRTEGVDARLDIVGTGRLERPLRRLTLDLGLEECVSFLGQLPHAEIAAKMAASTAVVLPSLHEGFPMVLLEAWSSGVPVVVTGVGAVPYVCEDGRDALIVPAGEPSALATAITRLLAEPRLAAALGTAGRRKAESFTYARLSASLDEHYSAVVGRTGSRRPQRPRHVLRSRQSGPV